jgi:hypothetical protein
MPVVPYHGSSMKSDKVHNQHPESQILGGEVVVSRCTVDQPREEILLYDDERAQV